MEKKHGDTICGSCRVSDLHQLKERLRSMTPAQLLAELEEQTRSARETGGALNPEVISAYYEVLDEIDPIPVPDHAYEHSRAEFARRHPELLPAGADHAAPTRRRRFSFRRHRLPLVALLIFFAIGGTAAVAFELPQRLLLAMGIETFSVGNIRDEMRLDTPTEEGYYTLEDALTDYGIYTYTPTWMPENMRLNDIIITSNERKDSFIAVYYSSGNQNRSSFIRITAYETEGDFPIRTYEDNGYRINSPANGLDFWITANLDETLVIWKSDTCIGNIWGEFTDVQIMEIINSIKRTEE